MKPNEILEKTLDRNRKVSQNHKNKNDLDIRSEALQEKVRANKENRISFKNITQSTNSVITVAAKATRNDNEDKDKSYDDLLTSNKRAFINLRRMLVNRRKGNEEKIAIFPDTKLAIEILASSILSPMKLNETKLTFTFKKGFLPGVDSFKSRVSNLAYEYIEKEYKLEGNLSTRLYDILAFDGCHPILIMSEASLDDLINEDLSVKYGLEAYKASVDNIYNTVSRPLGILSHAEVSNEAFDMDEELEPISTEAILKTLSSSLTFSDDVGIFSKGKINASLRSKLIKERTRSRFNISLEDHGKDDFKEKLSYLDVFRDKTLTSKEQEVQVLKKRDEASRISIGKPLHMPITPSAVFPICAMGDKDEHLAYFIAIDSETGFPLSHTTGDVLMERLQSNMMGTSYTGSPVTNVYNDLVKNTMGGDGCCSLDDLKKMYEVITEKQIFETLRNSVYGESVDIANLQAAYNLLFARGLSGQRTTLLFVPKESLVYYSLYRNDLGIGKTILDDLDVIYNLRSIITFAKVMAYTRNAIPITEVIVDLPPNDVNPMNTIEEIKSNAVEMRRNDLPLGVKDVTQLLDWIQTLGLMFKFKGHPDIPEFNIDFNSAGMTHEIPDSEYEDALKHQAISGIGLPPELIDDAFSPEFAEGIFTSNALLAKRTRMAQSKLNPNLTKHAELIIYNDYDLRFELGLIIKESIQELKEHLTQEENTLLEQDEQSFIDYMIDKISENVEVELPSMNDVDNAVVNKEFSSYSDRVEEALDKIVNEDMFSAEDSGIISEKITNLKASLHTILISRWAAENKYLPEVFGLFGNDPQSIEELTGAIALRYGVVVSQVTSILDRCYKIKENSNKELTDIENKSDQYAEEVGAPVDE